MYLQIYYYHIHTGNRHVKNHKTSCRIFSYKVRQKKLEYPKTPNAYFPTSAFHISETAYSETYPRPIETYPRPIRDISQPSSVIFALNKFAFYPQPIQLTPQRLSCAKI